MARASNPTRRSLLAGAAATAALSLARPGDANPLYRGGHPRVVSGAKLTSFAIDNTSAAATGGSITIGLGFKKGDMPAGQKPRIQIGAAAVSAQYNARSASRWADGSLRFCTANIVQPDFTASETRNYDVYAEAGAFDNSSAVALSSITGSHDFKVVFTNVSGSVSGALPDHTASLNTHAGTTTRVTQYEAGPYRNSWEVWGMASAGGVDHAHLKTTCFVSQWRDASTTILGHELWFAVQQDWWSIAGKEVLSYDAALYDGTTLIETYAGVQHPYMMHWLTVRLDDDDQHATRHWLGNTDRPQLLYRPNQANLIAAKLAPPINLTTPYSMPAYTDLYVPGSAQGHRASLPDEGSYAGRGVWSNMECIGFAVPTPENRRIMRTSSFAAAHLPFHRRSNDTRTRPGESADTANTIPALILWDSRGSSTPSSYYDFTADGMPTAAHAYADSRTSTTFKNGYVAAPNGSIQSGTTTWSSPDNIAHFPSMCHAIYIMEGERYFLKALMDIAAHATHSQIGSNAAGMPAVNSWDVFATPPAAIYPGATATQWAGVGLRNNNAAATRGIAWPIMMMRHAVDVIGDAEVEANYLKQYVANNGKYMKACLDLYPSNQPGIWAPGLNCAAGWMESWLGTHSYMMYEITGDPNWLAIGEFEVQGPISWYNTGLIGGASVYHWVGKPSGQHTWSPTNDWFAGKDMFFLIGSVTVNSATDVITASCAPFTYTNGDRLIWCDITEPGSAADNNIPSEINLGQIYYIVNATGSASFQLSDTLGGPPKNFSADITGRPGATIGIQLAGFNHVLNKAADGYFPIAISMLVTAYRNGSSQVTSGILTAFHAEAARVGIDPRSWATWNYSETA